MCVAALPAWLQREEAHPQAAAAAPDPSLDFTSPSFDAARALSTSGLQPPVQVDPLSNVAACRWLLPPEMPESLQGVQKGGGSEVCIFQRPSPGHTALADQAPGSAACTCTC